MASPWAPPRVWLRQLQGIPQQSATNLVGFARGHKVRDEPSRIRIGAGLGIWVGFSCVRCGGAVGKQKILTERDVNGGGPLGNPM